MELHENKFQLLPIQCAPALQAPDGSPTPCRARMEYLGTTLTDDVHDNHELVKRIAMAEKDLIALSNVWRRSSLTWRRKLAIYAAMVDSKLLYSLSSICLTVAQERRLNGFQSRCIRVIIGVQPSFISRVSNAEVLAKSGHAAATQLLRKRQMKLLESVLQSCGGHPLRAATFIPRTDRPLTERFVRRRGRPCKEWIRTLLPLYSN